MESTTRRRIRNLVAWLGGALTVQICIIILLSGLRPDPAYGFSGTLFFAGLFNVLGTLSGLVGYALAATALPSLATGRRSFAWGAIWVVIVMAAVYLTDVLPASWQLPMSVVVCLAVGSISFALANRPPSDLRRSGS
jgi:drug/metabolite transporter superfamily protein YnfA